MTRALVVDDRPEDRDLLRTLLEGNGFEVEEARHGAEALALARAAPPQLVISDLLMPVMDGYTLLRHWKADEGLNAIPFVVATATYGAPGDRKLAQDLGADAYILKPIEPEAFMRTTHALLRAEANREMRRPWARRADDRVVLKEYSEVLVHKLEKKALELEQANRLLREDIARREEAEALAARLLEEGTRSRQALLSILEDEQDARAALHESEAKLRSLVDGLGSSMFVALLTCDGAIMLVNRPALSAAGVELADVAGKPVEETPWFTGAEEARAQIRGAVVRAAAGEASRFDMQVRGKDGGPIWLDFSMQALRDESGRVACLVPSAMVIDERKIAEEALRESAARVRNLSRHMMDVETRERRSINRELHDRIGQGLATLNLNLQLAEAALGNAAAVGARAILGDSRKLLEATIAQVRNVMADMHPPALDDFGLLAALREHCGTLGPRLGIEIPVTGTEPAPRLARAVEATLFRIAQEALTNAAKHAGARNVGVDLESGGERVTLTIADDGRGLAPARTGRATGTWGLDIMRERAEAVGATFRIDSAPGRGTRVIVEAPRAAA